MQASRPHSRPGEPRASAHHPCRRTPGQQRMWLLRPSRSSSWPHPPWVPRSEPAAARSARWRGKCFAVSSTCRSVMAGSGVRRAAQAEHRHSNLCHWAASLGALAPCSVAVVGARMAMNERHLLTCPDFIHWQRSKHEVIPFLARSCSLKQASSTRKIAGAALPQGWRRRGRPQVPATTPPCDTVCDSLATGL